MCVSVRTGTRVGVCGYVCVCMRLLHVCSVHSGSVSQSFFTYGTSFLPFIFVTFVLAGKESLDGPLRNLPWTPRRSILYPCGSLGNMTRYSGRLRRWSTLRTTPREIGGGGERRAGREKDPNVHDPACAWRRRQRAAERRLSPTISTIHAPNNSMKSGCAPGREIAPKERGRGGRGGRREGESNIALNGPADSAEKERV